MSEQTLTTSSIISFTKDMENRSSRFYTELAERFEVHREAFTRFAQECSKTFAQVKRTYQETISDALEAGYSFQGLSLEEYVVDLTLPEALSLPEAVGMALDHEERAIAFYLEAAERSESLLATIPRAFARAAKTRRRRRGRLESLL